jgi:hypothetical protein
MKPLPESFTASLLKEAQEGRGLDALARFAAAAVVMKMLDSSRDRAEGARAQAHAKALLERSEALSLQKEVGRPGAPRLFVQAETPDGTEDVGDRYHSGFLPNIPVGMDQGMVRLAEEFKTAAAKWVKEFRAGNLDREDVRSILGGKGRLWPISERVFAGLEGRVLEAPAHITPSPQLLDPTLPSEEVAKFLPLRPLANHRGTPAPDEVGLSSNQRAALRHPNAPVFTPSTKPREASYHEAFPEEIELNPSYPLEQLVNPRLGEEVRKAKGAPLHYERERMRTPDNDYSHLPSQKQQIAARTLKEKVDRLGEELRGKGLAAFLAKHPQDAVHDAPSPPPGLGPLSREIDGIRKRIGDARRELAAPPPPVSQTPLLLGGGALASTMAAGSLYAKHKKDQEAEEKQAMGPLVPPAPAAKVFARKGLLSDLKGPAGFKLVPPSAQPKTAPATSAAPAGKPHPLLTPGGLATLGVLGAAGVGLNKALDSATGYMNQEAPPTDWAMRRYGALSPAQTTNVYGQPNY